MPEAEPTPRQGAEAEFDAVRTDIIRLAALTTEAITAGTQAFLGGDPAAADAVEDNDDAIDDLYHRIEDRLMLVLAAASARPSDLRAAITTMRISHELERTADLVVNVAKATKRIYPHTLDPRVRGIIEQMGQQAVVQTRTAIDAFADRDPSWASVLAEMDDAMDDLTKSLFRYILAETTGDEGSVLRAVQVALVGRHYERMADHAVTIAERVQFMVTGTHPGQATDD